MLTNTQQDGQKEILKLTIKAFFFLLYVQSYIRELTRG